MFQQDPENLHMLELFCWWVVLCVSVWWGDGKRWANCQCYLWSNHLGWQSWFSNARGGLQENFRYISSCDAEQELHPSGCSTEEVVVPVLCCTSIIRSKCVILLFDVSCREKHCDHGISHPCWSKESTFFGAPEFENMILNDTCVCVCRGCK